MNYWHRDWGNWWRR